MDNIRSSYIYKIGGLYLNVLLKTKRLDLAKQSGSYKFILYDSEFVDSDFSISFSFIEKIKTPPVTPSFSSRSFGENQIPYEWEVFEFKDSFSLVFNVNNNPDIDLAEIKFKLNDKSVNIKLQQRNNNSSRILFDPFFLPLGPILLNYLVHHAGGVMLHSSGVKDNENGYVFTAVSGTGKSTMAGLWQKTGAQIINDDRLVLIPGNDGVMMTNTPMPYYQDVYKESPVTAIFLIKQSPENYLKPLPGAAGVAGLMSNCIQFLYNKKMVQKHLEALTAIAEKSPIYELGFKPDTEITDIIRREFGG